MLIAAGYTKDHIDQMDMDEYETNLLIVNITKHKEMEAKSKSLGI